METVDLDETEITLLSALIRGALTGKRNQSTRFRLNVIAAKLHEQRHVAPEPSRRAAVSIEDYITAHPGVLGGLDGISRFLGKVDRPDDIDLWEFDCFISAIRAMLEPHDAARDMVSIPRDLAMRAVEAFRYRASYSLQPHMKQQPTDDADAVIRAIGGER